MRFSQPNLPENARHIILGERYADKLSDALSSLGLEPLWVPNDPFVDPRLAGHADLSVLHMAPGRLCLAPHLRNSRFADELMSMDAQLGFAEIHQGREYPLDAALNSCVIGNTVVLNESTAYYPRDGKKRINVRQGYTKCAVCPVSEKAAITADRGIYSAAKEDFDILLIEPGHIALEGFDFGFIGGACFKLSADTLCFTGRLDAHPDAERITAFLAKHGIRPLCLTDEPLFDIGSAFPITEKQKEKIVWQHL